MVKSDYNKLRTNIIIFLTWNSKTNNTSTLLTVRDVYHALTACIFSACIASDSIRPKTPNTPHTYCAPWIQVKSQCNVLYALYNIQSPISSRLLSLVLFFILVIYWNKRSEAFIIWINKTTDINVQAIWSCWLSSCL